MHVKSAQTRQPIHELMRDRWSSRAFSSEPISESEIIAVLEAGRWAPSSYNEQPWRFLVGLRPDELWHKIFDALDAFNQAWCSRA
ncbi:MAG: nitroreductase family protein, partial [Bacteroidia bacterium]|nr:nitroreductase family protein [Bacteroidia bacterium]